MNIISGYCNGSVLDQIANGRAQSGVSVREFPRKVNLRDLNASESSRRRSAFSLVEVVMAIGIISFALVAVIGMIPVGLSTMRDAMDDNTAAQIANQITGEVLLTPFSKLDANFSAAVFYYDDQGIRKDSQSDKTRYWAETSLVNASYPGSSNVPTANPVANSLATVRVNLITASSANAVVKSTNFYNIKVPNSGN